MTRPANDRAKARRSPRDAGLWKGMWVVLDGRKWAESRNRYPSAVVGIDDGPTGGRGECPILGIGSRRRAPAKHEGPNNAQGNTKTCKGLGRYAFLARSFPGEVSMDMNLAGPDRRVRCGVVVDGLAFGLAPVGPRFQTGHTQAYGRDRGCRE